MDHFLIVEGIIAAQTKYVEQPFKDVLNYFNTIIEIGFDKGGFSLWLNKNKKDSTKLVCYDITFTGKQVDNASIDFRIGDCFSQDVMEEIKSQVQKPGKTLLLCDGGNKQEEFRVYSKFLKSGDVIMLHDYQHSNEDYNSVMNNLGWKTPAESSYDGIKNAVSENKLRPYNYDSFKNVLWGAFEKE